MKTEELFSEALKKTMKNEPLETISVLKLSKMCKKNRQTFYYHFRDIYDLLTWTYLNERIDGINETSNYNEMLDSIFAYINANKDFIHRVRESSGKELFNAFIFNNCYKSIFRFVILNDTQNSLSTIKRKAIAKYYASFFVSVIEDYINGQNIKILSDILKDTLPNILRY